MVKISEFGLAKDLNESECYKIEDRRKELPVKWMSIEAVEESIFTLANDVVSSVVLMLGYSD